MTIYTARLERKAPDKNGSFIQGVWTTFRIWQDAGGPGLLFVIEAETEEEAKQHLQRCLDKNTHLEADELEVAPAGKYFLCYR